MSEHKDINAMLIPPPPHDQTFSLEIRILTPLISDLAN